MQIYIHTNNFMKMPHFFYSYQYKVFSIFINFISEKYIIVITYLLF